MTAQKIRFILALALCAGCIESGLFIRAAGAEEIASGGDSLPVQQKQVTRKPRATAPAVTTNGATANALASVAPVGSGGAVEAKPAKKPAAASAKGPYYVDFRARTAATYGHAFVWYGKTNVKAVDVAGLHPAGDEVPYVLGHFMWVPSETGASYGDLDPQYLTASYRVYLSEEDAPKVFAFIKGIQAHSPLWNAETYNCTAFIGRIATFMGMKVPFHLQLPENYVNELRRINDNRQTAQLASDQ